MGATFNALMEEKSKASLAEMCCDLMDEIAALKQRKASAGSHEFLNPDFLELMNDIGRLGHEKFGADAIESAGARRRIPRHSKEQIMRHAHGHLWHYEDGMKHDKLGNLSGHLAAAAFNAMLEYIFSQGE